MTVEQVPQAPNDRIMLASSPPPPPPIPFDIPTAISTAPGLCPPQPGLNKFSLVPDSQSSVHAFSVAEKTAFVKHINDVLGNASELSSILPIDPASDDVFNAVQDGILLCKLINVSVPGTIDESKMVKVFKDERSRTYHRLTNHLLCIDAAKRIGAKVVNLGAEDLVEGKPYLVFGLLWQIIKIGLLKDVSVSKHPELFRDMKETYGENMAELPAEELLLKWFNWHLKKAGVDMTVTNFSSDMKTSEAYVHLMNRLIPETCSLAPLEESDPLKRAAMIIANAETAGLKTFVAPEDIVVGNEKLNLAFVAGMFNKTIGMLPVAEEMEQENTQLHSENDKLKEQMQEMENAMKQLSVERATLNSEVAALQRMKENLGDSIEGLKREREELAVKIHKIYNVNEKLTAHIHAIDSEKRIIEETKDRLAYDYENVTSMLLKTTQELERDKKALEYSEMFGSNLSHDLEQLRSKHEKLEFLIEHLKIERMRSEMHVERLRILYNSFPNTEALCMAIYKSLSLETILQGSTKSGYLTKKARNGNNWRYRFFVLRDNFLFYYKSDKDTKSPPNGIIRVDDAVLRFAENPTKRDLKDQWLLCIEVPNNNESIKHNAFYVAGEDTELEGWKEEIRTAAGWWTKKSSLSSIKRTKSGSNMTH